MLRARSMVPSVRHSFLTSLAIAVIAIAGSRPALAGPPLVVDDPETLDRGQVELFTSVQFTKNRSMRTYETPTELTIGLAPGWECSINGSWQYLQDASTTPQTINGVLSLGLGTKYRLLTESATVPVSVALSGTLRFPISPNAKYANQGKVTGGGILVIARTFGAFTINANMGYGIGGVQNRDYAADAFFLGLSAQRIFAKKYTVFAETYTTPQVANSRSAVINADGGLLWDFSDRYRLSFLLGRGFRPGCAEVYANVGFLLSLGPTKPAN